MTNKEIEDTPEPPANPTTRGEPMDDGQEKVSVRRKGGAESGDLKKRTLNVFELARRVYASKTTSRRSSKI